MIDFGPSKYHGLEMNSSENQEFVFNLVSLRKRKGEIILTNSKVNLSIEQLKPKLKDQLNVVLCVNLDSILHKTIANNSSLSDEDLFYESLPTEQLEDYYFQVVEGPYQEKHLSFMLRKDLKMSLKKLGENGIFPTTIFIGPNAIAPLLPLLKNIEEVSTSSHIHSIIDGKISRFEKKEIDSSDTLNLFGRTILPRNVIASAMALYSMLPSSTIQPILHGDFVEVKKINVFRKRFDQIIQFGLLGLFVALFINFIWFDQLRNKNVLLNYQLDDKREEIVIIDQLEKKIEEQNQFIENNPWVTNSQLTFYIDRILREKPVQVKLTRFEAFPFLNEDEWLLDSKTIQLEGETPSSLLINEWQKALMEFNWVKEVEVIRFQETRRTNGTFLLDVKLNYE